MANDGFDVEVVNEYPGHNKASWEHAEKGKEGTITYDDETKSKKRSKSKKRFKSNNREYLDFLKDCFNDGW